MQLILIFSLAAHSPDNSFMGFVVENHINETNAQEVPRRNKAVVYGKAQYMWQVRGDVKILQTAAETCRSFQQHSVKLIFI